MADEPEEPQEPVTSKADAMALLEQAEAEAAEAEAMAAAARARARAARLRREALAFAEAAEDYADAAAAAADVDAGGYDKAAVAEDHHEPAADDYDDDDYDDDYDDEADYEPVDDLEAEPAFETARRRRLLTALAIVAAILVIGAFTAASAYMLVQHRDTTHDDKREAAFIAGAKQSVLNMISLDFSKAKDDYQRMLDSSTGQFKDDFQQHANDFISVVENSKAVTEGTINAAAVESTDADAAVVLVSATSRVTNSPPGKDEPPKTWRLRVTITDVGGRYKMSKVEYVT